MDVQGMSGYMKHFVWLYQAKFLKEICILYRKRKKNQAPFIFVFCIYEHADCELQACKIKKNILCGGHSERNLLYVLVLILYELTRGLFRSQIGKPERCANFSV